MYQLLLCGGLPTFLCLVLLNELSLNITVFDGIYICDSPSECHLGDVMVSVLATGPKVLGIKPSQSDGLLRMIKIHSTPSFG
jgi:hypothetical protein